MRSTFRDWVGDNTKFPSELAELALAHAIKGSTEAAYWRDDALERRRPMMERLAPEHKGFGRLPSRLVEGGRKPLL
jgi:hypothetical protein